MVPDCDCSVTNIEGTHQILHKVNDYLADLGRPPVFTVQLVALHHEVRMKKDLFKVCPDAGLLDGRRCTTHWELAGEFRRLFPAVHLETDKIITAENDIYTSGGAYSWLNLILYLVEKYAGREVAVLCAKGFQIDIQRTSQSPFIIFSGQKDHEDHAVRAAQEFIESNIDTRIAVDQLASRFALGRKTLERRFKKATGNTVMEYVQRLKMEVVKKSLETSRLGINEAMDKVGYSDPKSFRIIFKKVTGLSPTQYRNRYNRDFV